MIYPIVGFILFFIAMWMPRPLAEWTGISMVWALLIVGVVFGIPMVIFERCVHRLAVNKEMDRILADQGAAPNGGPATPTGNSGVAEGPPSAS